MFYSVWIMLTLFTLTSLCDAVSFNLTSDIGSHNSAGSQQYNGHVPITITPSMTTKTSSDPSSNVVKDDKNNTGNMATQTQKSIMAHQEKSELPLTIIIASPAVAVAVGIFICITYRWHSKQLDDEARKMARKVAAGMCSASPCMSCRPGGATQLSSPGSVASPESELFLGTRKMNVSRTTTVDSEVFHGTRTKTGSKAQTPESEHFLVLKKTVSRTSTLPKIPSLPTMKFSMGKGSSWSVLTDQDLLPHESPRRHSIYMV